MNEALKKAFSQIGIYKKGDMADYLGYKTPYFSGVINGKEKLSESFLKLLSDSLGININWIKTGEGDMLKTNSINQRSSGDGNTLNARIEEGKDGSEENRKLMEMLKSQQDLLSKSQEHIDRLISIIEQSGKTNK